MDGCKHQKRMAVINDFTGFGRCSLTVSIPIISHMKVQCCPVPTSVFSNHTAFSSYFFDDYTERMPAYVEEWKKLDLSFDGIQTGFLGSERQISLVTDFLHTFRGKDTCVIVDPVMGDHGTPYSTFTPALCASMGQLAREADLLTPNLTEACILAEIPYREGRWKSDELFSLARILSDLGPEKVVISGVPCGSLIGNVVYERGQKPTLLRSRRVGRERCGTGDIFASVLAADAVNHVPLETSVKKATRFIQTCLAVTEDYGTPATDGVCFEEVLDTLH